MRFSQPGLRRLGATVCAALAGVILLAGQPARAIQVADPNAPGGRYMQAPPDPTLSSLWNYAGYWGQFTGTPIGPNHFITAAHVGGRAGEQFLYQGQFYNAVSAVYLQDTDIIVWQVDRSFDSWAPLYTGSGELGLPVFAYGRSGPRSTETFTSNGIFHGWWGAGAENTGPFNGQPLSWGTNRVDRTVNRNDSWTNTPGGEFLSWGYYQDRGPSTGAVTGGDSGGGVFVQDTDGVWKLAGVIYGYDGFYTSVEGIAAGWAGPWVDSRGLYVYDADGNTPGIQYYYIDPAEWPEPLPSFSYASRLSVHMDRIRAISPSIGISSAPEPATLLLALPVLGALGARARNRGKVRARRRPGA